MRDCRTATGRIPGKRGCSATWHGNAANASVALSRLGVKVFLSTVIGNDEVGNILKQKLLSENIDLSYTHCIDNFKTSISSIIIDKNGERLVLNNRKFNDVAIKNNIDYEIFDGFLFESHSALQA